MVEKCVQLKIEIWLQNFTSLYKTFLLGISHLQPSNALQPFRPGQWQPTQYQ